MIGTTFAFNAYKTKIRSFGEGKNQLEAVTNQSSIRVIVFFTDGAPNTFSSYFDFDDNNPRLGSIRSGDGSTGDADALWRHNRIDSMISDYRYWNQVNNHLLGLP